MGVRVEKIKNFNQALGKRMWHLDFGEQSGHIFFNDEEPLQSIVTSCTHTLLNKPRTRAKHPLHSDRVILRLHQHASPNESFASKEI